MGPITFRRLERDDFGLLRTWLARPHVARWWNHDLAPEAVERDFGPAVDGDEPGEDLVVLLADRPVGLIQVSRFADYPEYAEELVDVLAVPAGAVSIDYLIGDPDLTARGLGRAMVAAVAERIWDADGDATCIIVPVSSANVASWTMLLRSGFHLATRGELEPDNPVDDGNHEIMWLDRPPGA